LCQQLPWFGFAEAFWGPMIFATDAERLLEPLAKVSENIDENDHHQNFWNLREDFGKF
jgi:hypothetical protein